MRHVCLTILLCLEIVSLDAAQAHAQPPGGAFGEQPINTWIKRTPLPGGPPSPRLGYEGACAWDARHQVVIRYGGHNQGGGGEQHAELWTCNLETCEWKLHLPNVSPPGICCGQQNVFDPASGRYVRFPAFSGSHGWQWRRELYLNDASVWTYDLATNTWRNRRPLPTPQPRPLRCAAWDDHHQAAVLFGGEGSSEGTLVYDPHGNRWTWMKPPRQPEHRSGGNMTYDIAGRQFVLFGSQFSNDPHTWLYDLRKNAWRDAQPEAMPPTNENDAMLTYDPGNRQVLAVIKQTTGKDDDAVHRLETWTYDPAANRWTKQNPPQEPPPSGSRARQLMFARELGLAILENRPSTKLGAEQQLWTCRLGAQKAGLQAAPQNLQLTTTPKSVRLKWESARDAKPVAWDVYRTVGERPWETDGVRVAQLAPDVTQWEDVQVQPGVAHHYRLLAAGQPADTRDVPNPLGVVRSKPRAIDDLTVTVAAAGRVELAWRPQPGDDVAGYHVERAWVEVMSEDQLTALKKQTPPLERPSVGAIRRIGPFERLTNEPLTKAEYVDTAIDLTQAPKFAGEPIYEKKFSAESLDATGRAYAFSVFAYRVRAVNSLGVVGGPSSAEVTIPSPPEHFFSRDDKTACDLKWSPPRQVAITPDKLTYRVYRMDGRYDKDAIPRLTPEPIVERTFRDPDAGKSSRRYYVTAVDVLGQEGFPSSPVWFNREWKAFYEPFSSEWRQ